MRGPLRVLLASQMAAALESPLADNAWVEFCERHATAAAQDFSKSCVQYMSMNMPESARAAVTHKDFLRKFLDAFAESFEVDFCKRRLQGANNNKVPNGTARHDGDGGECGPPENGDGSPRPHHTPFFRRYVTTPRFCKTSDSNNLNPF